MKEKPTESRGGVKGGTSSLFISPLQGQGAELPCGVWGNAPTVARATNSKEAANKVQAAKRPAPKLRASSDAPPSCSIHHLCCVAPDGRDHDAGLATIAAFPASRGFRARDRSPRALWGAKSVLLMQSLAVLRRKERQLDVFDAFLHPMRLAKQGNMM